MVPRAQEALAAAEVVVGYKTYMDLISGIVQGKKLFSSAMRKEVLRCRTAIDEALAGARVVIVSSGDAGIYGMAGLVFDICRERGLRAGRGDDGVRPEGPDAYGDARAGSDGGGNAGGAVREGTGGAGDAPETYKLSSDASASNDPVDLIVEVVPGVPSFNAAASLLGAPLMHDFAAVSLSDHLTPRDLIEKRISAAAEADFVIAIYNPRSKSRPDLLEAVREILLRHRSPETPVGIVRRAMRDGQWKLLTTLAEIPFHEVDMQSMVIVGNSRTYVWNGWMVTPRGYLDKYDVL